MIAAILLVLGGAAILALGGETALRGSIRTVVAARGGRPIAPVVLGALLLGINLPSVGAVVVGAAQDHASVAAGAAFGTIAMTAGLGLGAALLVAKEPIQATAPVTTLLPLAGLVIAALTIQDLLVSRAEGVLLVVAFVAYVGLLRRQPSDAEVLQERGDVLQHRAMRWSAGPAWLQALVGVALVWAGAGLLVSGATRIGDRAGLAAGFAGAAIVGSLASANVVAEEVGAVRRGRSGPVAPIVAGTVAAFSTGALGIAALIKPLVIDSSVAVACVAASALYVVTATVLLTRGRAARWTGVALLVLFGGWLAIGSRY